MLFKKRLPNCDVLEITNDPGTNRLLFLNKNEILNDYMNS